MSRELAPYYTKSSVGIGTLLALPVKLFVWERWTNGEVDAAIASRFGLVVEGLAKRGMISGWEEAFTDEDASVPEEYAALARLVMEAMMSRIRPSALTWLLK